MMHTHTAVLLSNASLVELSHSESCVQVWLGSMDGTTQVSGFSYNSQVPGVPGLLTVLRYVHQDFPD